jgi:RHS repeat-associated protein
LPQADRDGRSACGKLDVRASQSGHAFTGREWDPEIGLYYYRARYYDPEVGRFISEDPLDAFPNAYAYVEGQPTQLKDPRATCMSLAFV